MTQGVIWGTWDSIHAGQQEALKKGFSECDTMLVIILEDKQKDKELMLELKVRKQNLETWLDNNGYSGRYTMLTYSTVEAAVANAGKLDFDYMYLAEHDSLKDCAVSLKQEVDANREKEKKPYAPYSLVPTVINRNDEVISDTKYRKRKMLDWDVTGYYAKKIESK